VLVVDYCSAWSDHLRHFSDLHSYSNSDSQG
jgi:hypothetical protein